MNDEKQDFKIERCGFKSILWRTHYPGSRMEQFEPRLFNFELGEYWDIEEKYWEDD